MFFNSISSKDIFWFIFNTKVAFNLPNRTLCNVNDRKKSDRRHTLLLTCLCKAAKHKYSVSKNVLMLGKTKMIRQYSVALSIATKDFLLSGILLLK